MRTLVVTGSGGAGSSTVAAAAAARAAREGRSTVLLSRRPATLPGLDEVPGLRVRRVDGRRAVEELWGGHADALAGLLPHLDLPPATSVVPLPGAGELAFLAALGSADADLVVVDAGPLADGLALAALPGALRWWLDQALPPTARALAAVRTASVAAGAARRGPLDAVLDVLPGIEQLLARDRLADATTTAVWLTTGAQRAAVPPARRAATVLGLHGLRIAAVLARVLPAGGPGEWWRARAAEQDAARSGLADVAPVHELPELAAPPADLAGAGALLDGLDLPASGGPVPPAPERGEGGWRLAVPLPFADRAEVGLTRWGDDLVVSVGEDRRSVRLDPLLRRCQVTGGRLLDPGAAAAHLEISFRPDPQQWPADLLAAEERTR
ncbi:ion transporter [Blastococcus sp. MG754426]|uniref:ArsA family ATPase n=1 Tax=unclassified Blastococcus TaxID=2619396 RepID=UPI001EEFB7FF|nr:MULTISPECIES: ArsA-related P-loop ATPase [unclassified Blastococcus]MCF6508344.1 ion transporter [Blastococcus sp. MG754426]MCF6510926.1 ion transporter [Blastococcus sp. MG754427]MCF6733993.1 ion transporter [Blastococcus sp. KM273129]